MKHTVESLLKKLDERIEDEDLKIELMEDISDSFSDQAQADWEKDKAELEAQIANEKAYIEELKLKYKERFLNSTVKVEIEEPETEIEKKEVIDIKEI